MTAARIRVLVLLGVLLAAGGGWFIWFLYQRSLIHTVEENTGLRIPAGASGVYAREDLSLLHTSWVSVSFRLPPDVSPAMFRTKHELQRWNDTRSPLGICDRGGLEGHRFSAGWGSKGVAAWTVALDETEDRAWICYTYPD